MALFHYVSQYMSRNIGRKMLVVISRWKVIVMKLLFILIAYIFQIFYKHVLLLCSGKKNSKSYKTRKEQQKSRKGRSTSLSKTKIKPNPEIVSKAWVLVGLNIPFEHSGLAKLLISFLQARYPVPTLCKICTDLPVV